MFPQSESLSSTGDIPYQLQYKKLLTFRARERSTGKEDITETQNSTSESECSVWIEVALRYEQTDLVLQLAQ